MPAVQKLVRVGDNISLQIYLLVSLLAFQRKATPADEDEESPESSEPPQEDSDEVKEPAPPVKIARVGLCSYIMSTRSSCRLSQSAHGRMMQVLL